jgi:hypothetical protein
VPFFSLVVCIRARHALPETGIPGLPLAHLPRPYPAPRAPRLPPVLLLVAHADLATAAAAAWQRWRGHKADSSDPASRVNICTFVLVKQVN